MSTLPKNQENRGLNLSILSIIIALIYEPLLVILLPFIRTDTHFFVLGYVLVNLTALSVWRLVQRDSKVSALSLCTGSMLVIFVIYAINAFSDGNYQRSCWSFIILAFCLYALPNLKSEDLRFLELHLEKWLLTHLASVASASSIAFIFIPAQRNTLLGVQGLIIPVSTFSIYLALLNRKFILCLPHAVLLTLEAQNHWQSSYLIIPIAILIAHFGKKNNAVIFVYQSIFFLYVILSGLSRVILTLLEFSSSRGYDNTFIREVLFNYAYNAYERNRITGGHFTIPIVQEVLNAGEIVVLPFHSDSLVFLLGTGLIGWILLNLTFALLLDKGIRKNIHPFSQAYVAGLISLQLSGIFSSLYSSNSYSLLCALSVLTALRFTNTSTQK